MRSILLFLLCVCLAGADDKIALDDPIAVATGRSAAKEQLSERPQAEVDAETAERKPVVLAARAAQQERKADEKARLSMPGKPWAEIRATRSEDQFEFHGSLSVSLFLRN